MSAIRPTSDGDVAEMSLNEVGCCFRRVGTRIAHQPGVNIRFISTLTAEDENQLAPGILRAVSALAGMFPIRFAVKLDTVDGQTYHAGSPLSPAGGIPRSSEGLRPARPPIES